MDTRQTQLQKVIDIFQDFRRYCKNNLKILNKKGELVPLILNQEQEIIVSEAIKCLEEGRPIRFILLKDRQIGVSTVIEALIYWWTATHKNIQSKIVAHDTTTSMKLYNMFQRYYENSNPIFQPRAKYNTRDGMTFDNDEGTGIKSKIDLSSAENTSSGRGDTIHWLHGSEVAVWRNGEELVSGLMQAVPLLPNTAIFLESTANGVGDFFHRTWQAAKRGESAFTPLFFPWSMHDEYRLNVPTGFKLTKEEKQIQKDYGVDDGQLMWRREKMKEFVSNPEKFYQEYPLTDTEAFLSSGNPRFDVKKLIELEAKCYDGQSVELFEKSTVSGLIFIPKPLPGAPLRIWKQPQDGREYVIGADVAEGIGGDYSVASVVDKESHETVARWRGDAQPADFGEILEQLGRYYNHALIGVEINNHGLTTVQRLVDIGYDALYRKESGIDERYQEYTSKLGWRTDIKSKPLMIDSLAEAIAKGQIIDYDRIFINECMTYVTDERGKTNAQEGCYDDCFVRGTEVLTDKGQTPIQKIKVGDLVMTRNGLKPVVATRKRFRRVVNNLGLTGTPDHPVITTRGEKALHSIGSHDTIYTWNDKQSSIETKNITDTPPQKEHNLGTIIGDTINGSQHPWHYIVSCGLIIMEIFRMDTMSIMSTTTPSITTSQILNSKQSGNTYTTTYLHQRGKKNPSKTIETSLPNRMMSFAWSAVRPLRYVGKLVQNIAAHSVSTLTGARRVYNLQVADKPEYFANSILVHNCVMATAIAYQLFEWTDVTRAKMGIKSTYPAAYMEKRKANRALIQNRKLLSRR